MSINKKYVCLDVKGDKYLLDYALSINKTIKSIKIKS